MFLLAERKGESVIEISSHGALDGTRHGSPMEHSWESLSQETPTPKEQRLLGIRYSTEDIELVKLL